MNNPLTPKQIMALLDTLEVEELRRRYEDQLDKAGDALLDKLQAEEKRVDGFLDDFGREFRERNPAPAVSALPEPAPFWQRCLIPNWVLILTIMVMTSLWFYRQQIGMINPDLGNVRGNPTELESLQEKNNVLVHALIDRGEILMSAGTQTGKKDYYREALIDFLQAYQLEPDNRRLLANLAQIYEKIGNQSKAEAFFAKWKAAEG